MLQERPGLRSRPFLCLGSPVSLARSHRSGILRRGNSRFWAAMLMSIPGPPSLARRVGSDRACERFVLLCAGRSPLRTVLTEENALRSPVLATMLPADRDPALMANPVCAKDAEMHSAWSGLGLAEVAVHCSILHSSGRVGTGDSWRCSSRYLGCREPVSRPIAERADRQHHGDLDEHPDRCC